MAVTVTKYETYNLYAGASTQGMPQINHANSAAGVFKVALVNASYTFNNDQSAFAQITNEISAANYTAGGLNLTNVTFTIAASGTATFDAADTVVTASGTDMSAAGAVVYYNSGNDPLMFFIDFGATETAADGTPFTLAWSADGVVQIS